MQGLTRSEGVGLVGERWRGEPSTAPCRPPTLTLNQPPLAPQRPHEVVAEAQALEVDPGSPHTSLSSSCKMGVISSTLSGCRDERSFPRPGVWLPNPHPHAHTGWGE